MPETFHTKFAGGLKGQGTDLSAFLVDPEHASRFRVYQNNVVSACADAIVKNYPSVERLVGTEFMRAVAVAS